MAFKSENEVLSPTQVQVPLSKQETRLLKVFLANPHIVLTRKEIVAAMDVTQGNETFADYNGRALDVMIGRLRNKIEDEPKTPQLLKTERGVGYIFSVDVERRDAE